MRIHIIGGAGSGKTFLANKLKFDYSLELINLDKLEWININGKTVKQDLKFKKNSLKKILKKDNIVIDGVYYDWCQESFKKCDYIFYLKVPLLKQEYRIIKRSIKRKLGIEKCFFRETFKSVCELLKWNVKYNTVLRKEIMENLAKYYDKVYNVSNYNEIKNILEEKDER